jgi:hypothetical protein
MTARKRTEYVVRMTCGDAVFYVDATVGLTPSRAEAARYASKRDAQRMGDHLCSVAAYKGDASWVAAVEVAS